MKPVYKNNIMGVDAQPSLVEPLIITRNIIFTGRTDYYFEMANQHGTSTVFVDNRLAKASSMLYGYNYYTAISLLYCKPYMYCMG